MTLSQTLAGFAADLTVERIPSKVRDEARAQILDLLGLALLCREHPVARAMTAFVWSPDVAGVRPRKMLPATAAAFSLAGAVHTSHLDAFHEQTRIHPGAPVLPALLGLTGGRPVTGAAFLAALVAGWEITCRLGLGAPDRILHRRGFHPTAACGVFGAAAGAARLLGQDSQVVANALGIAGTQVPGSFEFDESGWTKPLQVGWASHGGVSSAVLATAGFPGPPGIFDGANGFFHSHCGEGNFNLDAVAAGLGERWLISETSYVSATHFTDNLPAAAAAVQGLRQLGVSPEAVEGIEVEVVPAVYRRTAVGEGDLRAPAGPRTARVSLYWSVAIAVARQRSHGPADSCHDAYEGEFLSDPLTRRLAGRVTVQQSSALGPGPNPVRVTVHAMGRAATVNLSTAPGDARWPTSRFGSADVELRFRQHAHVLDSRRQDQVLELVGRLEQLDTIHPLVELVG